MKSLATCKICDHDVLTVFDRQFQIDYYYCPRCEFLYQDEDRILPPEQEKAEYLTHNNTLENEGYVDMFRNLVQKTVVPFQSAGEQAESVSALDFGSGPGDCVLAHLLEKEFHYEVDTYDIFFSPVDTYKNKQYHLVTCTEVIEHVREPLELLVKLKKRLKPGGLLMLTTLFHPISGVGPGGELAGEAEFQKWWYRRDVTHICFFRPKTFQFLAPVLDLDILLCAGPNTVTLKLKDR